jgi:hypothetical protein
MRSGEGWLTPEALREGVCEEHALVDPDDLRHHVRLEWAGETTPLPWRVTYTVLAPGGVMVEVHNWWYERLKQGRWRWQEQVTQLRTTS